MYKKEHRIIAFIIIVAIIALAFVLSHYRKEQMVQPQGYSVVYLTSGEIYIGKVSTEHNKIELTDGYSLVVTKDPSDPNDPAQNSFQLQPLDQTIWATQEVTLMPQNIIFYGPIESTSKIAMALAGQGN